MDMLYEDYQDYLESISEQMRVGEYLFWFNLGLTNDNTTPYTTTHNKGNENEILRH